VQLPGGVTKRMEDLRVGDKVLAATPEGQLEFQDVYFFGHRASGVKAAFVRLDLDDYASDAAAAPALELTPDHFVPVITDGAASDLLRSARMTYARDVRAGDKLLIAAAGGERLRVASVAGVSYVRRAGLFNPYTLGGTIVVDGVLASAHSSWLVDGVAAALGLTHRLPAGFQLAFAPLRALYATAGPDFMQAFGDALAATALRLEAALLAHRPAAVAPAAATSLLAVAASVVLSQRLSRRRQQQQQPGSNRQS